MRFQLLGGVRAWIDGEPITLGTRKQRVVLAVLALDVNRLVPASRLIDLIWPDDPPASARGMIHTYVSRLRAIVDCHRIGSEGVSLRGEAGGYELRCDPECIDVHRFRVLVARARHGCDDERRAALLEEALALWHGAALAGASDDLRARLCDQLDEERLAAAEDRFDALLRLGSHHELIDKLVALVAEHPGRQRLTAQLMLALHRAGRTPEALRVYDRARRQFAEEFGLDPAVDVQRLHQAILRADPL
jgi:DNA-binding SARP family transcriptional activator